MNRNIPCLLASAAAAAPLAAQPATALAAGSRIYYGPAVHMAYGPVRVEIRVTGSHMTMVWASTPREYPLCVQINRHAVPILVNEALQAQSVSGVHRVSGASLTTGAFKRSLAAAMAAAHLAGA